VSSFEVREIARGHYSQKSENTLFLGFECVATLHPLRIFATASARTRLIFDGEKSTGLSTRASIG